MKEVLSQAKVGDKLEGEGVHGDAAGMGAGGGPMVVGMARANINTVQMKKPNS